MAIHLPHPDNWDKKTNERLKAEFGERLRKRIREVRESKKMKQHEVAARAGIDLSYLGHIETGKYQPTAFMLWKLSKALGVSISELANF